MSDNQSLSGQAVPKAAGLASGPDANAGILEKNPTDITSILNPSRSTAHLTTLGDSLSPGTKPADLQPLHESSNEAEDAADNDNDDGDAAEDDNDNDNDNDHDNDNDEEDEDEDDNGRRNGQEENDLMQTGKKPHARLPPRKRSKVSRACDECRRKKVRCNAVFDMNSNSIVKICTNCEKNNDSCMFTRVPLKRGPNKGYTKKSSSSSSINSSHTKPKNSKRPSLDSPEMPPSPTFFNPSGHPDTEMLRIDSNASIRSNSNRNSTLSQFVPPPPPHPASSVQPPYNNQQVILPPLNSIPFSDKLSDPNNQQAIFWKVPTEMPSLPPNLGSHARKGSVDSTHSSLSSASSISSVTRNSLLFSTGLNREAKSLVNAGVENSDSEDEFLATNSGRLSRSTFQVPFTLQSRSPRVSFTSDKEQRSSASSIMAPNSISSPTARVASPRFESIQPRSSSQNNPNFRSTEYKDSLYSLLDNYYANLYPQYPLLPNPEIMKMSIGSIIDNSDFFTIIELFSASLHFINVITSSTNSTPVQTYSSSPSEPPSSMAVRFREITRAFEVIASMYLSKSLIYQSVPGKILFTSTLLLLNYAVVLSGYDYSLGFGIAFSYFNDWLIFKEGYDSPCFANLIQLVVLDALHTLYYGLPRSSTVCFAINTDFIKILLQEISFTPGVDLEWLSVGLHLVVLSNNLQELDSLNKLETIVITGTEYKFMSIIKLYYELYVYCSHLNAELQRIISAHNEQSNSDVSLTDDFKRFIYNVELNLSKLCKKLTNLIDEQLDDIEMTKPNPMVAVVLVRCAHISINTQIFVRSIIHLNEVLDFSHSKSNFNFSSNAQAGRHENRSGSDSSINSFGSLSGSGSGGNSSITDFSSVIGDCNRRFAKLNENVASNLNRSQNIKQTHQHARDIVNMLINSKKPEIVVPRTTLHSSKGGVDYSVVIQNWVRLVNIFFSGEITKEGINGWSNV